MIPFDLERIERETAVGRVVYVDETASTNTLALELAERDDAALPVLVLAARQTAGRGRGGNRWWSSEGALTFSLLFDAEGARLPPARRPLLSLAAGLAVCEALSELLPQQNFGVKWPNDVYLAGRKVCGILVESARRGERVIVGVGLNVNNTLSEAPPDVARRAIALCDAAGGMLSLTETLARVVRRLCDQWNATVAGDPSLVERLRQRCILTGRRIVIDAGGQVIAGLCRGLAEDGALAVETTSGLRCVYAGVVTAIDPGDSELHLS